MTKIEYANFYPGLSRDEVAVTAEALMQYIENEIGNKGASPDDLDMQAASRVLAQMQGYLLSSEDADFGITEDERRIIAEEDQAFQDAEDAENMAAEAADKSERRQVNLMDALTRSLNEKE